MNGLEKITSRIADEAKDEVKEILKEAKAAAAGIAKDYAAIAKTEYESKMASGTVEVEQNADRIERAARLDAKKEVLALKQELIGKAYETAKAKILAMDENDYAAFLGQKAGAAAVTGNEQIIMNAADAKRVGAAVVAQANKLAQERGIASKLSLSSETRPISGGLVLKEGNVEVNCTLDTLLELVHNELDAAVAGILF